MSDLRLLKVVGPWMKMSTLWRCDVGDVFGTLFVLTLTLSSPVCCSYGQCLRPRLLLPANLAIRPLVTRQSLLDNATLINVVGLRYNVVVSLDALVDGAYYRTAGETLYYIAIVNEQYCTTLACAHPS